MNGSVAYDAGLLADLVADIRRTLKCGSPPHAKLAAIWDLLDEAVPWQPPPDDPWRVKARAGDPDALAETIRRNTGPLTLLLEDLSGRRIRAAAAGPGGGTTWAEARWTEADLDLMQVKDPPPGYMRKVRLTAGPVTAVHAECKLIPGKLPAQARHDLGMPARPGAAAPPATANPAGSVLAVFGLTRDCGDIRPGYPPAAVVITARLLLSGEVIGVAREEVTLDFCAFLAASEEHRRRVAFRMDAQERRRGLGVPLPDPPADPLVFDGEGETGIGRDE